MSIYSRRQITALYRSLLLTMSRDDAMQLTAKQFNQCINTVEAVITQSAVTGYLQALGLDSAPAHELLKAAANAFGITVEALAVAVEEQYDAMGA